MGPVSRYIDIMISAFAVAPVPSGLRQASNGGTSLLRPQGSGQFGGQLQRQNSGSLRTQDSGNVLHSQGSGPLVTRRSLRTIPCASSDGAGLNGASPQYGDYIPPSEHLRPQSSQPTPSAGQQSVPWQQQRSQPLPQPQQQHAQQQHHHKQRRASEAADLDALLASSVSGIR